MYERIKVACGRCHFSVVRTRVDAVGGSLAHVFFRDEKMAMAGSSRLRRPGVERRFAQK